jgi:hypothetical protein
MNEVYAEFFGEAKPARTTVVAAFAIPGIKVEIDAVAHRPAQARRIQTLAADQGSLKFVYRRGVG